MTIKANRKQNYGQYFTSSSITEFMVQLVIDEIKSKNRLKNLDFSEISTLEPAAGDGAFIDALLSNGFKNITAYEIDKDFHKILQNNYGNKVRIKNSNFLEASEEEKYDLIIGNPPYLGQNYASEIFQEYCHKYSICQEYFCGNMDLFYWFIHLGIRKLKPGGLLCFITTNYWIQKGDKTGVKKLKPHIVSECFLNMYVDLSNLKVFREAPGQHNCIFILQKKTEEEKIDRINKKIEIVQFKNVNSFKEYSNEFQYDLDGKISYISAITNNNLKINGNWNLLYPEDVEEIIKKIEKLCADNSGKVFYLKYFFQIRNGIISIKDDVFILKENDNLLIKKGEFSVKIGKKFFKLNDFEKKRLKKIYKSRCIRPYSFNGDDYLGWMIVFDKREFDSKPNEARKKYPILLKYLSQFEDELKKILIQCKESPNNWMFLRRGIKIHKLRDMKGLRYLEHFYENEKKIFFPYISKENIFGYTTAPFYATSDTYFLHNDGLPADFDFLIAYLNSKMMNFIFNAKGLKIKRSKSKIENCIPIPFPKTLKNRKQREIYEEITALSKKIVNRSHSLTEAKNRIDALMFDLFDIEVSIIDNLFSTYYNL